MLKILLTLSTKESSSNLFSLLDGNPDVELFQAESGKKALELISDTSFDLVVTDETLKDMTGLELAEKMLSVNPMINCAAVSELSAEAFHEASEGLGILAQLPREVNDETVEELLGKLKEIKKMTGSIDI
jgi:YesN/AraC family two-component response regulator